MGWGDGAEVKSDRYDEHEQQRRTPSMRLRVRGRRLADFGKE